MEAAVLYIGYDVLGIWELSPGSLVLLPGLFTFMSQLS